MTNLIDSVLGSKRAASEECTQGTTRGFGQHLVTIIATIGMVSFVKSMRLRALTTLRYVAIVRYL